MNKKKLEKLQVIAFIIVLSVSFVATRFFSMDDVVILYIAGVYWGFVILINIIYGLSQGKKKKALMEDMPEKQQKKEKAKLLDKAADFVMGIIVLVIMFPIWIWLARHICPLDYEQIEALDCIEPGISLMATFIGLMIIGYLLRSLFAKFRESISSNESTEEEAYPSVIFHLASIFVIVGLVLLVYWGTLNWGTIFTEDSFTVKRLWYEKTYCWDSMQHYTFDRETNTVSVTIVGKTYRLFDDYMDETTKPFNKKYEEDTDFVKYLFTEQYTYIDHEFI